MSTWQSFFNQLSKPVNNNGNLTISNKICHCNEGTLVFCGKNSYHPQGDCSLNSICCAIQIDKHRAYSFSNNITVSEKPEISVSEETSSRLFSFDRFLDR